MGVISVGVVGCGLVAQIMHLPHLRELPDKFRIQALCDLSQETLDQVSNDYQVESKHTNYLDLISDPKVEAVLVLSSGNHAPIVQAAVEANKHVFVEKPLCYTMNDADNMIEASLKHNVCLMVGYMKWFDPTYQHAKHLLDLSGTPQFVQITTINTPEEFYYRHHRVHQTSLDSGLLVQMKSKRDEALSRELPDVSPEMRSTYVDILLDSAIHDIYVLRGLVGDPAHLIHADIWANGKACNLIWRHTQDLETQYSFLLLSNPGGRYRETVSIYCPNQRVFIDFPSPYLRNMPTSIVVEKAVEDRFVRTESLGSFEEAFKNELLHFHECITEGREPLSSGIEGRKDVAIMQNVIRAATQ